MLRRLSIFKSYNGPTKRYTSTSPVLRAQALRKEANPVAIVKRNPLGVQLLSSTLHSQVFRGASAPPAPPAYLNIALDHLAAHGLDPSKSSQLPSTAFTMPELQGNDLLEHFWRIGLEESQPYLGFAEKFSQVDLPPMPEYWELQAGWTKYVWRADGSGYSESVAYPGEGEGGEQMLCFDVETLPNYHPYPIMATAASERAWYGWISPWLLDPASHSPEQLVPLGPRDQPRIIVGHNVSYDRARTLEEYHLGGTQNRFLDTMAMHVAVKGISSHQRPAWMKYRKQKDEESTQQLEALEAVKGMLKEIQTELNKLKKDQDNEERRKELVRLWEHLQGSLGELQDGGKNSFTPGAPSPNVLSEDSDSANIGPGKTWEDLTAMNSLADVAKLYCDIDVSKEIRNDFMVSTPEHILAGLQDYLSYCAKDVWVTHQVYRCVLPGWREACPHPVSFAGVLEMGSGFLTVNESWEKYINTAEGVWLELEKGVKDGLEKLARDVMANWDPEQDEDTYAHDPWLSQLDWSPKVVGASRGVGIKAATPVVDAPAAVPSWYETFVEDPLGKKSIERILPLILQLSYHGHPMLFTPKEKWHFIDDSGDISRPSTSKGAKIASVLNAKYAGTLLRSGDMHSCDVELAQRICAGDASALGAIVELAERVLAAGQENADQWASQLSWTAGKKSKAKKPPAEPKVYYPKWFWDLTKPKKDMPPGSVDITMKNRIAPLLLRMSWHGWPLFFSRKHGWTFRVPDGEAANVKLRRVFFEDEADLKLRGDVEDFGYSFFKLPHKDGDSANVGSPLGKTFFGYASDGTLKSGAGDEAKRMVDVGVQCSYWVSARERIKSQMVQWQHGKEMGIDGDAQPEDGKWGVIVPQVITMGTVTRRAIEKTWLTASNAKANRVGSELKSLVRAPPDHYIVGADVDSEELWISSCMGDAQFGEHGSNALGWMTLEGTKAQKSDLHSKTADILGISRDQAKVFNYSRIYGAGMKHAMLLLQQANSSVDEAEAKRLASDLYAKTKGRNTHRTDLFEGRKFWYGGSESFVFNKLEGIALSERPETPALGCSITHALAAKNLPVNGKFGSDYMPSRINWVVQSSGVDYLHLLIVSMRHLIRKYDIRARYLISVHDELRYLVHAEDRYRLALALQIANFWTRSQFAVKLGFGDLPEGVAWFSSVDVDRVLRKEVDMGCVTPSQPTPIPKGEAIAMMGILEKTNGGSLWGDGRPMEDWVKRRDQGETWEVPPGYVKPDCLVHRASSASWLRAQATDDLAEIKHLSHDVSGPADKGKGSGKNSGGKKANGRGIGNGEGWEVWMERLEASGQELDLW
ncbi:hypothetical protein CYLTODRAFT_458906 [Cylindrobasidium torrendii FP15055 ss-10]|uniref:Mitochondrial DNA polymerase catalytic subunit n=1 Tax=Cylindrobasidium torrendii FP15055 ss-10 TaxID=1314674 RepID=A0A0D7AX07_9AGAR|nr:hypothetical protein CYLTODRAFT_458906 [Cylindrobasidium torrendii FP15055 ss-10]